MKKFLRVVLTPLASLMLLVGTFATASFVLTQISSPSSTELRASRDDAHNNFWSVEMGEGFEFQRVTVAKEPDPGVFGVRPGELTTKWDVDPDIALQGVLESTHAAFIDAGYTRVTLTCSGECDDRDGYCLGGRFELYYTDGSHAVAEVSFDSADPDDDPAEKIWLDTLTVTLRWGPGDEATKNLWTMTEWDEMVCES